MILVINTGSSSVKFQLLSADSNLSLLAKGCVQDLGKTPYFNAYHHIEPLSQTHEPLPVDCTHEMALRHILHWIHEHISHAQLSAVAHRVVHGGVYFDRSVIITPSVMTTLQTLCPLAPLHQPHNLRGIEIIHEIRSDLTQIACFDTAFHAHHTPLFTEYALPERIRAEGVRRYGFHGLSYEWIIHHLNITKNPLAHQRIVAAHLGNGASLCALHQGTSIDTTMGLTALDGLPMGTRCGSLDPGAVIYLLRDLGHTLDEIESILYKDAGLKGLSNWTNDVQLLTESDDTKAQFAIAYFCLKTAQFIAMMAVSLGGIDGLVFTGGIGENSTMIRNRIIEQLDFLMPFETLMIPANEEKMMAIHALSLIST